MTAQPPHAIPAARDQHTLGAILAPNGKRITRIGFVATMGALHEGHLSLIKLARQHADFVVTSIFVNPKQFGPNEDFDTYPRTEEADLAAIAAAGGDAAYIPTPDVMYPDGYQTKVLVPELAKVMDGASRPGFFDGIATVVTKLLNQVAPQIAVFGEKDFQQLLVIRQLVRDLDMKVNIIGAPIIRDADGLAMSSRNRYLSTEERRIAGQLNVIMRQTLEQLRGGVPAGEALADGRDALRTAGLDPIDYFELRAVPSLAAFGDGPLAPADRDAVRLFAAVNLGRTRLIDNMGL